MQTRESFEDSFFPIAAGVSHSQRRKNNLMGDASGSFVIFLFKVAKWGKKSIRKLMTDPGFKRMLSIHGFLFLKWINLCLSICWNTDTK